MLQLKPSVGLCMRRHLLGGTKSKWDLKGGALSPWLVASQENRGKDTWEWRDKVATARKQTLQDKPPVPALWMAIPTSRTAREYIAVVWAIRAVRCYAGSLVNVVCPLDQAMRYPGICSHWCHCGCVCESFGRWDRWTFPSVGRVRQVALPNWGRPYPVRPELSKKTNSPPVRKNFPHLTPFRLALKCWFCSSWVLSSPALTREWRSRPSWVSTWQLTQIWRLSYLHNHEPISYEKPVFHSLSPIYMSTYVHIDSLICIQIYIYIYTYTSRVLKKCHGKMKHKRILVQGNFKILVQFFFMICIYHELYIYLHTHIHTHACLYAVSVSLPRTHTHIHTQVLFLWKTLNNT